MKDYKISKTELGTLLGKSTTTIQNWSNDSSKLGKCIDESGKIDLCKVVKWLYEWKEEEANKKDNSSDEKKFWDAKRSEASYKEQIQELVPKTPYLQTEKERFLLVKSAVLNLPEKLSPELGLTPAQRKVVENSCRSIIEGLKNTFKNRNKDWADYVNSELKKDVN